MLSAANELPLPASGILRVRGADSVHFLQGQLSQDVELVSSTRSALAGRSEEHTSELQSPI